MNNLSSSLSKKFVLGATVILLVVGLGGCGKPVEKILVEEEAAIETRVSAAPVADVATIIEQAQTQHDKAIALSHGWTRTQPLIDNASVALDGGDAAAARTFAKRALAQATASVEQAQLEVNAWKVRAPK